MYFQSDQRFRVLLATYMKCPNLYRKTQRHKMFAVNQVQRFY